MNILWLTNIPLPEACILMNEQPNPFGGWLEISSARLAKEEGISLSVAFPKISAKDVLEIKGNNITYFVFPTVNEISLRSKNDDFFLTQILNKVKPDVVHIFGTEFAHTLAMVNACNKLEINLVISIQGLVSVCAKHYMANLPLYVQNRFTIRDFIKQDNINQQRNKFVNRGAQEIEALQKVKHVIGRTTWDRACTYQINPDAKYHFCNETLREEFYKHIWDIDCCEKHSIFISQGSYPIKGLHFMLEAMPLILRHFPEAKLYIGGQNITKSDTLKEKFRISSYGKYIRELIMRYNLNNNVVFTGILNERQMCERYLQSHVFVCPSSIENSSNSLGEAMILGVPCVASAVGGVTDLITHNEEGFVYQIDAPYMLAYYICELFSNNELVLKFSENARNHALLTNDPEKNLECMIEIYKNITGDRSL